MYFNLFRSALIASALAVAVPAAADSLGFRYADLTFGAAGAASGPLGQVRISTDVAITGAHGLQLDLGVIGYPGEFLGQIDAHLYMIPTNRAKYGVYFSLADVDGREATIASVGVEAMFALSANTALHGRAGTGMAMPGHLDFITASLGINHALTKQVAIFAGMTATEIDETSLRAVAITTHLGARYQPTGKAWEVSASLVHDGLTGRDAAAFETRGELNFTLHLGAEGAANRGLAMRAFTSPQPFDPLLRRGVF